MDLIQQQALARAESMKLFERDGLICFGKWREWWNAPPQDKPAILKAFKNQTVGA